MDKIMLALSALQLLLVNPKLGGGGIKREDTVKLIDHLKQLIAGGAATKDALEQFANRINDMAVAGQQPVRRDFDDFTARLSAAMDVVAQAKQRIEERQESAPEGGEQNPPDTSNGEASPGDNQPE